MTEAAVAVRLVAAAGPSLGRGHVARAMAVGEALVALGARVEIELARGDLTELEARRAGELRIVAATGPSLASGILYVDLPDPNDATARGRPERVAVVDDRDAFRGHAGLVIQPSQPRWSGPGRADRILEGYAVVPIAAAYRGLRAVARVDRPAAALPRVVACFGGADPGRVSERLVGSLVGGAWSVDVIVGASYTGSTDDWPLEPVRDPSDLPDRIAAADVAVLAAGTMKFEAACLGRPAILVAAADDQLPVGPPFAASGAAVYLGDGRTIEPSQVHEALESLVRDPARREAMGRRAGQLVDGGGADRIARALLAMGRQR